MEAPIQDSAPPVAVLTEEKVRQLVSEGVQKALRAALPPALRQATEKAYLTKKELMDLTGWSARTVEYKKTKRQIPFVRQGRTVLFPTEEVYAYFEEGRVEARES